MQLAGNKTVQAAHNALINSPGHRKNILSSDYTHIGIGIQKGGQYGNMFTQDFRGKLLHKIGMLLNLNI